MSNTWIIIRYVDKAIQVEAKTNVAFIYIYHITATGVI